MSDGVPIELYPTLRNTIHAEAEVPCGNVVVELTYFPGHIEAARGYLIQGLRAAVDRALAELELQRPTDA